MSASVAAADTASEVAANVHATSQKWESPWNVVWRCLCHLSNEARSRMTHQCYPYGGVLQNGWAEARTTLPNASAADVCNAYGGRSGCIQDEIVAIAFS